MKGARYDDTASEARDLVRRAVGDASGLTIKAQLRQAARNLGYAGDAWRLREAWYGRAGRWVGTALRELQERFAAWIGREAASSTCPSGLAQRVAAFRQSLFLLMREVDALDVEVRRLEAGKGSSSDA